MSARSPTSFLPRVAGEDEGGGLNVLNDWNIRKKCSKSKISMSPTASCSRSKE
jgi:hypothetical protein